MISITIQQQMSLYFHFFYRRGNNFSLYSEHPSKYLIFLKKITFKNNVKDEEIKRLKNDLDFLFIHMALQYKNPLV